MALRVEERYDNLKKKLIFLYILQPTVRFSQKNDKGGAEVTEKEEKIELSK